MRAPRHLSLFRDNPKIVNKLFSHGVNISCPLGFLYSGRDLKNYSHLFDLFVFLGSFSNHTDEPPAIRHFIETNASGRQQHGKYTDEIEPYWKDLFSHPKACTRRRVIFT